MGEADDGRELGPNKVIVALFLFFSGVGWLCAMAGLAAMQNYCVDGQTFIYVNVYVPLFAYSCSNIYALDWWVVWFTFFTLILAYIFVFTPLLRGYRSSLIGLLALNTILLTNATNTIYQYFEGSARQCYFAGLILLDIFYYTLVLTLGSLSSSRIGQLIGVYRHGLAHIHENCIFGLDAY
eukprot:EC124528.1.p1 GENE.EC124528.1~~EC124528.1.p1  ORF type:complete len:181 (+),score=12.85 EC124528.1:80-622(+)